MKIRKTGIFAAVALAATVIFAACPSPPPFSAVEAQVGTAQTEVRAERVLPINFEYKAGADLEKGLAGFIEGTNAKLGVFLVEVRAGNKNEGDLLKMAEAEFKGTYLENPILRMNDGNTAMGWRDIVPALRRELSGMMYVSVHSVHALLEYIPLESRRDPDIDFRALVRIRLACAPTDCTWLESEACHRNLCTWEPCPGGI